MRVVIRIPRFASPGVSQGPTALATEPLRPVSTFHAALTDSAEDWVIRGTPRATFTPRPEATPRTEARQVKGPGPGMVARGWAWFQAKLAQTATKRLRVAETVSLGEKRFVSIVNVEGREFLIGGGTSGVTLLAQLGPAQERAGAGMKSARGDAA
jgi:hypothetical protein